MYPTVWSRPPYLAPKPRACDSRRIQEVASWVRQESALDSTTPVSVQEFVSMEPHRAPHWVSIEWKSATGPRSVGVPIELAKLSRSDIQNALQKENL